MIKWLLLIAALCVYAYLPVWTIWHALNNNDFKHIYFGMKALLDGYSPYPLQSLHLQAAFQGYRHMPFNPYVYLPFTGHAMAILAPFTFQQAVGVWFTLNHLFVGGSILIISKMFPRNRMEAAAVLVFCMALNVPLYRTLTAGQLNLALLFMICLGWDMAHRNRRVWCGVVMAFAALYKLMPGIYGVYFLLRRQWPALLAMILSGIAMLTASIIGAGPKLYWDFISVLKQMGYGKSTWPEVFSFWDDPSNQSLNSFFSHILTMNDHTTPWIVAGQSVANGATIAVVGVLGLSWLIICRRKRRSDSAMDFSVTDEGTWCATLILALLVPSLMWDHYLVMLILPAAWMVRVGVKMKKWITVGVVVVAYAVTCAPFDFAAPSWRQGAGIILMSLKLWPTLLLYGLSLCFIRWSLQNASPAPLDAPESIH